MGLHFRLRRRGAGTNTQPHVLSMQLATSLRTQSLQNPLIKEYTLNHIRDLIII